MSRARVCVVKIGGSLLASADLPSRLRSWLLDEAASHGNTHFVLLSGCGKLADAVREIDAVSPLGDEAAHWICVELLDVAARILGSLLPELAVVDDFTRLESRLDRPGTTLFCPSNFVRHVEPSRGGTRLARDWSVTSDSIAARLAIVLAADELVLLKSADPTPASGSSDRFEQLAASGYVDRYLPQLLAETRNVRAERIH